MAPKRRPGWVPKLTHHKARGMGRVRIPGRGDVYLGTAGCWPRSQKKAPRAVEEAYRREIARWLQDQAEGRTEAPRVRAGCTVSQLIDAFAEYCLSHYRKRGKPTSEVEQLATACRQFRLLYGTMEAARVAAEEVLAFRDGLADGKLQRTTVNAKLRRVRRLFDWGAERGLVPHSTAQAVRSVKTLARNRSLAREGKKVKPAPEEHVEAALPHLNETVRAMVQVQRLTGMRPMEVCSLRPCDLDRSGDVWRYEVHADWNKMDHKGQGRTIWIGPRAQALLSPFLDRAAAPESWVFPQRSGRRYSTTLYGEHVARACARAGVPRWSPNRLRHNRATDTRAAYGLEGTAAELGHANPDTSLIYAERDAELAKRIARESG